MMQVNGHQQLPLLLIPPSSTALSVPSASSYPAYPVSAYLAGAIQSPPSQDLSYNYMSTTPINYETSESSYPSSSQNNSHFTFPPSPNRMNRPKISLRGFLYVYRFDPIESVPNSPITVRVDWNAHLHPSSQVRLRITFDGCPLATTLQRLIAHDGSPTGMGDIRLAAVIPPPKDGAMVAKLAVEAVEDNVIIDIIDFGHFLYCEPRSTNPITPISPPRIKRQREDDDLEPIRRFHPSPFPTQAETDDLSFSPQNTSIPKTIAPSATTSSPTLDSSNLRALFVRTSQLEESGHDSPGDPASLVLAGDLSKMSNIQDWSDAELAAGRRLVIFKRQNIGSTIHLDFEAVAPDAYNPATVVISCIYRPESNECYVTSVDCLFLLSTIVGERFTVQEKNRVRRNLEKFRPKTVSKTKGGQGDFFHAIMTFPTPRPRNIEKDVKVFAWGELGAALDKVIGKYSYLGQVEKTTTPNKTSTVARAMDDCVPMDSSPSSSPFFPIMHFGGNRNGNSSDDDNIPATTVWQSAQNTSSPSPSSSPASHQSQNQNQSQSEHVYQPVNYGVSQQQQIQQQQQHLQYPQTNTYPSPALGLGLETEMSHPHPRSSHTDLARLDTTSASMGFGRAGGSIDSSGSSPNSAAPLSHVGVGVGVGIGAGGEMYANGDYSHQQWSVADYYNNNNNNAGTNINPAATGPWHTLESQGFEFDATQLDAYLAAMDQVQKEENEYAAADDVGPHTANNATWAEYEGPYTSFGALTTFG